MVVATPIRSGGGFQHRNWLTDSVTTAYVWFTCRQSLLIEVNNLRVTSGKRIAHPLSIAVCGAAPGSDESPVIGINRSLQNTRVHIGKRLPTPLTTRSSSIFHLTNHQTFPRHIRPQDIRSTSGFSASEWKFGILHRNAGKRINRVESCPLHWQCPVRSSPERAQLLI
jgi:hypothetical protein